MQIVEEATQLKKRIDEIVKEIGDRDGRDIEYYLDYRESVIDEGTLAKLLDSDNPEEAVQGYIWEWASNIGDEKYMYEQIIEEVKDRLLDEFDDELAEVDDWDIVRAAWDEDFHVTIDESQLYRNSQVNVVVAWREVEVLTIDNWEFSPTGRLIRTDDCTQHFLRKFGTSMTRLVKWYNAEKFTDKGYDGADGEVLKSIYKEFIDLMYSCADVVFMFRLNIEEYLDLLKAKKIKVLPRTSCGFVNFYPGAGSILEIKVPEDGVVIDMSEAWVRPDKCIHYGIDDIYGGLGDWQYGEFKVLK